MDHNPEQNVNGVTSEEMFKIKAQNAFSFEQLEFDFTNRGLCLVQGVNKDSAASKSNGAGKSSILDILCWGLYGECLRLSSVDKIVNNKIGKDCVVDVWWGTYHVTRYRKHTKHKNDVQFFDDEQPITGKSNAETQLAIDKALGLSYETFIKAIYFQQNTLTSFAKSKDSEQKSIIEDILGLNAITEAQKVCKEKVKVYETALEIRDKELQTFQLRFDDRTNRIKQIETREQQWDQQQQAVRKITEDRIQQIEEKMVAVANREPFDFEQAKQVIAATDSVAKDVAELEKEIYNLINRQNEYKNNRSILEMKRVDMESQQLKNIAERDRLDKTTNPPCPTCGKLMDAATTVKRLADINNVIDATKQKIVENRKALETIPAGVEWGSEIESHKSKIASKKQLVDMAIKLRHRITEEEYLLKERATLEHNLLESKMKLSSLDEQANPYGEEIAEETHLAGCLEMEMEAARVMKRKIEEEKAYYDYWVDGLSNSRLKSYIMDSITPILNERANYYSKFLTGGEVEIEINTQTKLKSGELRDKFSVNTTSINSVDYEQSSGGQRKRIDICILLALHELVASRAVNPLKLMIVDELSENLDSVGLDRLLELLKEIAIDKGSLLYVTHNEDLQNLFPNVLTVVMENGTSRIQGDQH